MLASFGFVNNDPKEKTNMSTSLLYHAYGLKGYQYVRTTYLQGQVHFTIRLPRDRLRCPICGSRSASRNSRLSCTTSVSAAPPDVRLLVAFVGARPFDFDDLGRRGLAGLLLALERRFIA